MLEPGADFRGDGCTNGFNDRAGIVGDAPRRLVRAGRWHPKRGQLLVSPRRLLVEQHRTRIRAADAVRELDEFRRRQVESVRELSKRLRRRLLVAILDLADVRITEASRDREFASLHAQFDPAQLDRSAEVDSGVGGQRLQATNFAWGT